MAYTPGMWISHVSEEEATGTLQRIYAGITRSWGGVDNIIKSSSLSLPGLKALLSFYNGVMHGDCDISLAQREMIAVTVSAINECEY